MVIRLSKVKWILKRKDIHGLEKLMRRKFLLSKFFPKVSISVAILVFTMISSCLFGIKVEASTSSFSEGTLPIPDSGTTNALQALTGDFDNDGYIDILTQDGGSGTAITFWKNNGDGSFTDCSTGNFPASLPGLAMSILYTSAADFDNDGDLDIYCRVSGANNDVYYINDGTGKFTLGTLPIEDSATTNPVCYSVGDFDNDGDIDILTQDGGIGTSVKIWKNNGSGSFPASGTECITGTLAGLNINMNATKIVDFDNDGDLDIYCRVSGANNDVYYENDGTGNFTLATIPILDGNTTNIVCYNVGDFDNDGDIDILTQDLGAGTAITFWENKGSFPFTNSGTGRITGTLTGVNLASTITKLVDFDNDGDLDIYVRVNGASNDKYFKNNNMPPRVTSITPASNATNVGLEDNITLILSNSNIVSKGSGAIYIKVDDGDGNYSNDTTFESFLVTDSRVLLTGNESSSTITINPSGNFEPNTTYYLVIPPSAFVDVEGKGFVSLSGSRFHPGIPDPARKLAGNSLHGIADRTVLSFSTANSTVGVNSVTVSPSSASVAQGGTQQLTATVTVTGGVAQTVNWTSNGTTQGVTVDENGLISVAANATLGDYTITATATEDSSKSDTATITIVRANAVTPVVNGPEDETVNVGGSASLSVTVDPTEMVSLSYQWYSNTTNSTTGGTAISGATDATYVVPTTTEGTTYYYCVITNTDNSVSGTKTATATSSAAKVVVNALTNAAVPSITKEPGDKTVTVGAVEELEVEATGTGTLSYQWYSNTTNSTIGGTIISGATSAKYTVPTSAEGTTYYYCVITNTDNSVSGTKTATATSSAAKVEVNALTNAAVPSITKEPGDKTVTVGEAEELEVEATGTGTLSYQWYSNTTNSTTGGTIISGATDATYVVPTITEGTTFYYCVVTNTDNSVSGTKTATATSSIGKVVVNALTNAVAPSMTKEPVDKTVTVGEAEELEVEATGTGTLSYQWYSNTTNSTTGGTIISGATDATYVVPTTTEGTTYYYCVVTNTDNSVSGTKTATATSSIGKVVVNALTNAVAPSMTKEPGDKTVTVGGAEELEVEATGTGTLSYQWYSNTTNSTTGGTIISGATSAKYTVATSEEGTTYYYCVITNTDNSVSGTKTATATSSVAKVEVNALTNAVAPSMTKEPVDKTVTVGGAEELEVEATGTGTLSYQWYSNTTNSTTGGTIISGATSAKYTVPTSEEGTTYYYCVITNTDNSVSGTKTATATSSVAKVEVNALTNAVAPSITKEPGDKTVTVGGAEELEVEATGTGTLSYQWYSNTTNSTTGGTIISGATSAKYTVPTSAEGTTYYYCVITNTDNSVSGTKTATATSSAAKVEVNALTNAATPIISGPSDITVNVGGIASLSVNVATADMVSLSYQWYSNTTGSAIGMVEIDGATDATYGAPTTTEGTTYYYCVVTNTDSSATGVKIATAASSIAKVVVNSLTNAVTPVISGPTDITVNVGESASLLVSSASEGMVSLSYQWYSNTTGSAIGMVEIDGAIDATYEVPTTTEGTTYYYCVVTNTDNSATGVKTATAASSIAKVVVIPEAPSVSSDDENNKILGANGTMEYSNDGGTTWTTYNPSNAPTFNGNQTVKVRVKANGSTPAGNIATITFTSNSSGGSSGETESPSVPVNGSPTQSTTVIGSVIDEKTGETVKGVEATVKTESNGTKTVEAKSEEAIVFKQPNGTNSAITDANKLSFSSVVTKNAGSATENANKASVTMKEDGTISVSNLANGTETKFTVTFDLGNGQKISIGTIKVSISEDGQVNLTSTLIDPYGIITDAASGEVIQGVKIVLYYANTARNKTNGKVPDTEVKLPILPGFAPSDNVNPQLSDKNGAYAWMVFPTSDYYIVGTKDGYEKYTSPIISVEQEIVRHDIVMLPSDMKDIDMGKSVLPNKIFEIKFNKALKAETVNLNNVYVSLDKNGMHKVNGVKIQLSSDKRIIEVLPPSENYQVGHVYYLTITSSVTDINGTKVSANTSKFTIHALKLWDEEVEQPISGDKIFRIMLNREVEALSVNYDNVFITTDKEGLNKVENFRVRVNPNNNKIIEVTIPKEKFVLGKNYYLFVDRDIVTEDNEKIGDAWVSKYIIVSEYK